MSELLLTRERVPVARGIVNVASVPQRSPFRYPGGKTWLVPYFRDWMHSLAARPSTLVEPFAGGGIISLTAVMENLVDRVVMIELDPDVAAVWKTILSEDYRFLVSRLLSFDLSRESVIAELSREASDPVDLAFRTLLRNRVQRGGILAPGAGLVKNGENGRGVASRWYPRTLARRIECIAQVRSRIEFHQGDGMDWVARLSRQASCVVFADPPYTAGGKRAGRRLYACNQLEHEALFRLLASASGPIMLTYDDAPEPRALAERYGLRVDLVPMSNTHHNTIHELVITNRW